MITRYLAAGVLARTSGPRGPGDPEAGVLAWRGPTVVQPYGRLTGHRG
ncbi:hypothetical protein QFW82_04580 [Streptomyces malaysiensis subsp. malaysiensis]|nr:hypothetical protein [Streptomyces sp. NA07423]WHX16345.1 hypothetical protein QFW82_04580 [Streptomyces sp. NA07423]